jgi:GNAT superfamily N-acetyltransferase
MEPNADAGRARFEAAVAAHLTAPLAGGIALRHVTGPELVAINERLWGAAARAPFGALDRMYTEEQRTQVADLGAVLGTPLSHRVLLLDGEDVIGCYWGQQAVLGRYHMVSTIVAPAYQGRGIYRELLERVVAAVRDSGFTEIHSWHRADNNAVIVPKLRAGFLIMGFEVTTRFGVLVQLRRYLVENVELLHRYRVDGSFAEQLRSRGVVG